MATYIKGVTDYIPVLEPFKPDYKFLSDVLSVRQDRYDTNFKSLNNLYSRVVYAPLTREDNKGRREQYANKISNGLKQVSGLDLSLQQNVDVAKGIFKPFFEDKALIKDMAFTKSYQKQMQTAERLRTDPNSTAYWDTGVQGLQMQMEKFRDGTPEQAMGAGMPKYIGNPNLYQKSFDALKDSGLEIKQTTLEGDWIVTTKNGNALTNHITGYKRDKDGTLIYDDNKRPIPIVTNPVAEYLANTVMKDSSVRAAYMLEAQVNAYNFGKENADKYGGREQAEAAWAKQTIEKYADEETKKLVQDNSVYQKSVVSFNNWKEYKKQNNIVPGSSKEEAMLLSEYNLNIAKANKEATEQRLKEIKSPANDQNSLMTIAYSAYMGGNMAPKMTSAAKAYSLVGAEKTLKANPFKQLERQHQFALNRMSAQHKFDMAKMYQKFVYDSELQRLKNQPDPLLQDLFPNVQPIEGDAAISGSPLDSYNQQIENDKQQIQQYKNRTDAVRKLFDLTDQYLHSDLKGVAGYQGGGQYKYTVYNDQYPNGQEKIANIAEMFSDLDPVYYDDEMINTMYESQTGSTKVSKEEIRKSLEKHSQANFQELDRITNSLMEMLTITNPDDKNDVGYVKLQNGSVESMSFPNTMDANASKLIGNQIQTINDYTTRINDADDEQNRILTNIKNYYEQLELEQGNLSAKGAFGGNAAGKDEDGNFIQEIPAIVVTDIEAALYKAGYLPNDIKKMNVIQQKELAESMGVTVYKDGKGNLKNRLLTEEEYANMFADIMYGTEGERSLFFNDYLNSGSREKDDYDFLMRKKRGAFQDDFEYLRYDFWSYSGGGGGGSFASPTTGVTVSSGSSSRPLSKGFHFNRNAALAKGRDLYQKQKKNMESLETRASAGDLELNFDRRAYNLGQTEYGDQILYNQYVSTFDVAAPTKQSIAQFRDLTSVLYGTPDADIRISFGDSRAETFENQPQEVDAKKFLFEALNDFRKGMGLTDKTQNRFVITDTYVEKAGGMNQPDDQRVAARYLQFSPEFLKERKSNMSDDMFKKVSQGFTVMYSADRDNNPYASKNQVINSVETIIRQEGKYESPFIMNGGYYRIYPNSQGMFMQEMFTYGVDETGNIVPDKSTVTPLNRIVDPKDLDALRIDLIQRLNIIANQNVAIQKEKQK